MNEEAKQYRKEAIKMEKKCREELIKRFFELKAKALERLDSFCETGIDEGA